jgi:hypothetical protein
MHGRASSQSLMVLWRGGCGVGYVRHLAVIQAAQHFASAMELSMTDIALPGSIEPAKQHGPKLDHALNPITAILFFGALAAGILFVAYSIYTDIDATGTKIGNYVPFLLLFVALLIALGFESSTAFTIPPMRWRPSSIRIRCQLISRWSGPACGTCWASSGRPAPWHSALSRYFQWS